MFERLLSNLSVPSDILYLSCMQICLKTDAIGGFIALNNLEYFDTIVGSLRERRRGGNQNAISMPDLVDIKRFNGQYIKSIYFYHSGVGWFVGIDSPFSNDSAVKTIIEKIIGIAYPVFLTLLRTERLDDDRDALTGVLTRKRFYKDIATHVRTSLSTKMFLYIFYIDFNNFKVVNDILGHDMGDRVLKSIASEISTVFLGYGNIYRVGGDEFIGVSLGISQDLADTLAKRLEKVSEQAPCGLFVNLSVGVEVLNVERYGKLNKDFNTIIKDFIKEAEIKMYNKKKVKIANPIICENCNQPVKAIRQKIRQSDRKLDKIDISQSGN